MVPVTQKGQELTLTAAHFPFKSLLKRPPDVNMLSWILNLLRNDDRIRSMVLISGPPNTGSDARTPKGKSEVQFTEDGKGGNGLLQDTNGLEEELRQNKLSWQGTGDPLPQLLAVVPSIEQCTNDLSEEEECEEYDDFSELSDTRSIASDDSFYPPDTETKGWLYGEENSDGDRYEYTDFDTDSFKSFDSMPSPEPLSVFKACSSNNAIVLRALKRQGLTEEEVCETDRNNRTGLLVACYQGYVDIVITLSQCPYIDVNWQDNEGNTALITAAQAGHITITNFLLNYYPGLDLEKRNTHGFTALMKASIQGRTDCVRALMLAGADIHAVDPNRGFTSREWARFTGRYDTAYLMQKLLERPLAEQFSDQFKMEWPKMKELLAKAAEPKSCAQRISECMKSAFTFNYFSDPEEDGVLDYMVRITTGMSSPFVAVSCRTVCPGSPPCIGKRRYSVQEIIRTQRAEDIKVLDKTHKKSYEKLFKNTQVIVVPPKKERRASLQVNVSQRAAVINNRRTSLLPLHLLRRSSVRPGFMIPKVRISKAPAPTYHPEKLRRRNNVNDNTCLQIPKWRYKEIKEQRKKAEEEALRKLEEAQKEKKSARPRT
ncbi:PREDICTED: ankyrin repeat domain-containing protein 33B-like [Nanorana parkeri]|uniref:ankyrin repeat domain-containing protein 33B-like n=1 Tax=Nanorana parkeri TaxID=125878 RepID=UPI0008548381|nr:PREDICTED: ankyrin repeat domain-containing protein 33B-like [Nanorana parkeri]